ncbi:MAG: phage tail protein [Solidesulfovibrio sp.]|uniref:phage tail protein n=1 Tax=Solidesulfovibrio sp. TaxID=2910990 RepID=UPI002B2051F0|nr:phage tail protein [Solidesulfovibrio sp.]MEA4857910.1 phage tail protein [Solidesulfovibrio sp.]
MGIHYDETTHTFTCDVPQYDTVVFSNFAQTTLVGGITDQDTLVSVADGAVFPALGAGQLFYAVLIDAVYRREIVKVTGRNGSTLTVARAQEGTQARAFVTGDRLELVASAAALEALRLRAKEEAAAEACATIADMANLLYETIEDLAQKLVDGVCPIGTVRFFLVTDIPSNFVRLDNGTAISRTVYPDLFAKWGTTFGPGDGSTTFGTPKMAGRFIRICDHGAGVDPDADTRLSRGDGLGGDRAGTIQEDQTKSHAHDLDVGWQGIAQGGAWAYGDREHGEGLNTTVVQSSGGNETRGKNIYLVAAVRAL